MKFISVLILMPFISAFSRSAYADEVAVDNDRPRYNVILDRLEDGVDAVSIPIITGQESEDGLFSTELGPANFRLSMLRGFEMTWDDSDFSLKFGGRVYLDAVHYFNDKNNIGDNGFGVRTILLDIKGTFTKNWIYKLSFKGFTNGGRVDTSGVSLDDVYLRYLGFDKVVLTMGQHTEPFSLEQQTSSLNITFMERALPNAFAPGSTVGISAATGGEHWFATGGFFSEQLTDYKDQGSLGRGFTGYVSTSPIRRKRGVIHIGSSFSYRVVTEQRDIFFRYRPESGFTDVRYVNTGTIPGTESISRFGVDAAGIFGPWSIQGEYIRSDLGRGSHYDDVHFDGWYVFLSWFPTGETRNYQDSGIFGSIEPNNKYGAIQLALRYSSIDLNDRDITGGSEQNLTFGINWYIHQQLRVMFNYIHVTNDIFANDNGSVEGDDSPHIVQMRFQANF